MANLVEGPHFRDFSLNETPNYFLIRHYQTDIETSLLHPYDPYPSLSAINIHPGAGWFVITSGALLGVTAGLLWTAQGSMMLSYCTEAQKGIYISIFGGIFNLGAVVGSAVSLGQNSIQRLTVVGILVLTPIGVTIPMLMADPNKVIRTDGTRVIMPRYPSWKSEFHGLWFAIITDPMIVGSVVLGLVLDSKWLRRRGHAFAGWSVLLVITFVVHIWAYYYQRTYTRASVPLQKMDIYDPQYSAHVWLMIFYGLLDAMWHVMCFFHSIQAAGSAIGWRLDALKLPYMTIFISTWCLVAAGLVFSFPMIYLRVRDTTVIQDEGLIIRDQEVNDTKVKE
ncbi:MFS general substrate transporter [Suillus lakei]|nr:MFS general substrate transporter [Suillus lakei]